MSAQVQGPRKGGTFIVCAHAADPVTLNPGLTSSVTSHVACVPAFDSLLETNMDLSVRPGLAERWEMSTDGLTYTFYLVKNATWHDEKKFTSADVKFTFEQVLLPFHPYGQVYFGVIQSIETPDDYTVRIKLTKPRPSFLLLISCTGFAPILPKHIFEGTNIRENPANWKPIGTGPFRFVEYVKGDRVVFERNPNYWRANKPYADRIIAKIIPKEETQVVAIQKGEIDCLGMWLTPAGFKRLQGLPDVDVIPLKGTAAPRITWLYFNLDHPILKDLKVRQAIVHVIDKNKISEVSREGSSPPAVGPVHYSTGWAFDPNLQPSYPFDLKKANQLLDEAGYPRKEGGVRFKLAINDIPGQTYNNDAEMIKDSLKEVGIEVDHQLISNVVATDLLFNRREFDMAIRTFMVGPDPTIALAATFDSKQIGKGSFTNCMGYKNLETDALLEQAQVEMDPAKRRSLMLQWQRIIMTELPAYPLIHDTSREAYRKEWIGVPANPWLTLSMFAENIWWTKGTLIEAPKTTSTTTITKPPDDLTVIAGTLVIVAIVGAAAVYVLRKKRVKKS
jgi:peptide/nickel transport system substrate-binding protein